MAHSREQLRQTFDTVAARYHEARPDYPEGLYDALTGLAHLAPGEDAVLEVGCGTGKATIPLARRGFAITAVELGAALAAEARRNLAGFPRVTVVNAGFETWLPPAPAMFGLVFAATAWHWIDPSVRYRKAWELLKPGGHLALWEAAHVFPDGGDPFFREIQGVYDEIGEGQPPGQGFPTPETLPGHAAELEATGLFTDVAIRRFDWEIRYTADGYLRLLDTFSGHIAMEPWKRERLYGEIRRRLARRPDGMLRRHWGAVLHVGRKKLGTSVHGGTGAPEYLLKHVFVEAQAPACHRRLCSRRLRGGNVGRSESGVLVRAKCCGALPPGAPFHHGVDPRRVGQGAAAGLVAGAVVPGRPPCDAGGPRQGRGPHRDRARVRGQTPRRARSLTSLGTNQWLWGMAGI